jgi:Zn finger protein HypA/HybF involved in hydrogenase expression
MIKIDEDKLIDAILKSNSKLKAIESLGLPIATGYRKINKLIAEYNIDISHMTGAAWNKGNLSCIRKSLDDILVEDSTFSSSTLRKRLIEEGARESKCESCGLSSWMGDPIPLELHHINGINTDNRPENLQILCPNCHAKTSNYKGKNIIRTENEIIKTRKRSKESICPECNKLFFKQYDRIKFCSKECAAVAKEKFKISREDLLALVKESPVSELAKKFEVSPNAVKKRCQRLGIDKPATRACW